MRTPQPGACLAFLCALLVLSLASLPLRAQDKAYHGDGPDDYLRFVPITAVYTMKVAGVESASSWKRLVVNSVASYALSCGVAWGLKESVHETRPDGTDRRSFPSGHTTVAFAGAAILDKEYRHVSPWISVGGYAFATGIAIDRVARNRHHWYDAAAGAAIGVGGTWLGYWLGDKITGERSRYNVSVSADGLALTIKL